MKAGKILVCDFGHDDGLSGSLRLILEGGRGSTMALVSETVVVRAASFGAAELENVVRQAQPELVFFVASRRQMKRARMLCDMLSQGHPPLPAMVALNGCNPAEAFELLNGGALDCVTTPLRAVEVLPRVWRLIAAARRASSPGESPELPGLVGRSPRFVAELKKVPAVASRDTGVLIGGETGTGKELLARAIHRLSPRAGRAFVPLNCAALPVELAESELFGHERGAFTGANAARAGVIEEAEGGTLFLDEVGCLPLAAQAKLLRFLQEKEYRRLGASRCHPANVRIIAATNLHLPDEIAANRFRQDLYYRLNIVPLALPPLRERREDIPELTHFFMGRLGERFQEPVPRLRPDTLARLSAHAWPGNVRELEHVIERAVVLCDGRELRVADLGLPEEAAVAASSLRAEKAGVIASYERRKIEDLLAQYGGNVSRSAEAAGKHRRAFWELIRKYGIDAATYRVKLS